MAFAKENLPDLTVVNKRYQASLILKAKVGLIILIKRLIFISEAIVSRDHRETKNRFRSVVTVHPAKESCQFLNSILLLKY